LVVGNFDGVGGDEVAVFYNTGGFVGGGLLTFLDLDTLKPPATWNNTTPIMDDVGTALGWTDKQLPCAYDMDGDGEDELVGHWGVLHPTCTQAKGTRTLSDILQAGERLSRESGYDQNFPFTDTNKYIMQKGVAGW
jgi:hypothetical protein